MSAGNVELDDNVTPVFGLTKSQLWPAIERATSGEAVASFDISIEHQVSPEDYGYRGDKVIPTFTYTTRSGRTEKITLFVKRHCDPGPAEAHHYANLVNHQAPIPRMYGTLSDPTQREIIFLEYLDAVTDGDQFLDDAEHYRQFLAVTARFNAIRPTGEYTVRLRRLDVAAGLLGGQDWDQRLTRAVSTLDRVWQLACDGELGGDLEELCGASQDKLGRLLAFARGLAEPVSRMATGLCHYDNFPNNLGRRRETGELLTFDLETVGFMPRFWDVAEWLGAPDEVRPLCRPRKELAEYYLEQYTRWAGSAVTVDQFLEEARILWMAWTFSQLWWWLKEPFCGPVDAMSVEDREQVRAKREGLHGELSILLQQVF